MTGEIISGDEDRSAKDIYYSAKGALARKQYELAIEEYRKIEANFPFSEYAEQSHIELLRSHEALQQKVAAAIELLGTGSKDRPKESSKETGLRTLLNDDWEGIGSL